MPAARSCELCEAPVSLWAPGADGVPDAYRCTLCGLVQLRLTSAEAERWQGYYRRGGAYHRERVLAGFGSFRERFLHDLRLARIRMENLVRFVKAGRLLDVGASNGALVQMARRYGFEAYGIEPDGWVVAQARVASGLVLLPLTFAEAAPFAGGDSFDAVLFVDSFEHLLSPHETLDQVECLLRSGGVLSIEMPDADCWEFGQQGVRWRHFKPREHAYLYGRRHVERLFERHGFELLDTIVPYPERRVYYARVK